MNLDSQKREEILKLIDFIKKMNLIIKTSPNPQQVERVKKDLFKYIKKLQELVPDYNPAKETIEDLEKRISGFSYYSEQKEKKTEIRISQQSISNKSELSWDNKIPMKKVSPNFNDIEVNTLYSYMDFLQKEFWPLMSEQFIQLDYTHSQERQTLRLLLDEVERELKSVIETIEDYMLSESPDFRDQLYKMKNKQTRMFVINLNEFLKKIRDFINKLLLELDKRSSVIKNPDGIIEFQSEFHEATLLNGYTIREALTEFLDFIQYVIKKINLPDLKQKKF